MFDRLFVGRLQREMPRWVERGWLAPAGREAILADLALRAQNRRTPALVFGGLGALLLGVGVVLFFAANWQAIPRWFKLVLIFGMVWASYGAAFALVRAGFRRFAEALVLLGVLLFGSAIMLIGQVYHLPADPPGGVLLWTLGALLSAYAWPSGLAAIAALALTGLWASLAHMETPVPVFWPFLLVWAVPLPLIVRRGWPGARHVALLAFFGWLLVSFVTAAEHYDPEPGDALRLAVAAAAALVALGGLLAARSGHDAEGQALAHYGLLLFAAMLFPAVIPELYGAADLADPAGAGYALAAAAALGIGGSAAALTQDAGRARFAWFCLAVAGGLMAVALLPEPWQPLVLFALNFVILGVWIGLISLGFRADDRFAVNLGFIGFAASLFQVYFTWFWSLFDRSLFFIAGGVMVLGLGYALERQRRRLIRSMEQPA